MKTRTVTFMHKGLEATIKDEGKNCVDAWRSDFDEWEENCFQATSKKMIYFIGKRLKVNWEVYFQFQYQQAHSNRILEDVGLFSLEPVQNWQIVDGGCLNLNPLDPAGRSFYFAREEDVVKYARLEYGRVTYHWYIQQVARVIPGI